ncbi:hypothetical protein [Paenibacillus sp. LPE1-1-1.1]|uniref:hypothetical protein n=1 Tax=Paenibacillus sp. LPE1-1-1.1 TaxID=3135230 RepID=UPI00343AAA82
MVMSSVEFKQRFTLSTVDKMLLDVAHDAESIYLLLEHQGMEPFIDLNVRSKKNTASKGASDIHISPKGIPICPKGNPMKPKWHGPQAPSSQVEMHTDLRLLYSQVWPYLLHENQRQSKALPENSPRLSEVEADLQAPHH